MQSKKKSAGAVEPVRDTYRHGDLRRSLIEAGLALARAGGPEAVVLREATRRAGVVPNAAYRHFANRDDLLRAVRYASLRALATAIEAEIRAIDPGSTAAERALGSFRAVGTGYLRFAATEAGLFRTAFFVPPSERDVPQSPEMAGQTGLNPFELLGLSLDQMVETGQLAADRRPSAEYLAWSAVHGFAELLLDGPLGGMSDEERRHVGTRLIDMVVKGI